MTKSKHTNAVCAAIAAAALVLALLFTGLGPVFLEASALEMPYVTTLFDTGKVHSLDIVVNESDWQGMLDNATAEEYIACSVVVDGESFKNVAIRPKGNTSLSTVASSDSDRYSFKIEFDHYDSTKTYHGLDKLALNNIIQDNTYLKDYLCYQMMNYVGADSPLCSFVWITVNGEDWGLYLAAEGVEEAFAQRNYGSDYGKIYKPDSMNIGNRDGGENVAPAGGDFPGGMGGMTDMESLLEELQDENGALPEAVQEILTELEDGTLSLPADLPEILSRLEEAGITLPDSLRQMAERMEQMQGFGNSGEEDSGGMPDMEGLPDFGGGGGMGGGMSSSDDVALIYSDDEYDSYSNIFDGAVFDVTDSDKDRLIAALKKMNEGDIENSVNVDEVIRYFVAHNFVLNGDSYTGTILHNYYLYEDDGLLSMIAWDYNLAFGGMSMGMNGGTDNAASSVNAPIDSPVTSGTLESRPMVAWIFENETYTELYHQVFDELIAEYFESGYFEEEIDRVIAMISPYVEKDPTAFCTYEEFLEGSSTLKEFCKLRAESIRGQLDGSIPSTQAGQSADSSGFVDASSIDMSAMGSNSFGVRGGPESGFGGMRATEKVGETDLQAKADSGSSGDAETSAESQPAELSGENTQSDSQEEQASGEARRQHPGNGGFGGQAPENGEMPEGMTPPDETDGQMPDLPEGAAPFGDSSGVPGMEPDDSGGESESGGETSEPPPEGETSSSEVEPDTGEDAAKGNDASPDRSFGGRMEWGGASQQAGQEDSTLEQILLLAGSAILLAAGLLFAKFFR